MGCSSRACLFAVFGLAVGNFVNPFTNKCLDVAAPCKDGSDSKHCERKEAKDLTKEANVQLFRCHEKKNQDFIVKEGKVINPVTGLCLDIFAPCKDGSNTAGCERKGVKELKGEANVQMYECHGKGNQLWVLQANGTVVNEHAGLCLDIAAKATKDGGREKAKDLGDEANVQVYTCHKEVYGNQLWDMEVIGDQYKKLVNAADQAKFQLLPDTFLKPSHGASSNSLLVLSVAGVSGLAVAAFAAVRARRAATPASEHMMHAEE